MIASESGAEAWAERLGGLISSLLEEAGLTRYGPPADDVESPQFG